MSLKLFVSHSWQDTHLVQELRRMLDESVSSYEITSVERGNPISFPNDVADDLAPKFYPVLSSLRLLDLPDWAVGATGAGAEPSA
jgi:hypothetical protein